MDNVTSEQHSKTTGSNNPSGWDFLPDGWGLSVTLGSGLEISVGCRIASPGGEESWSQKRLKSTDECRKAISSLLSKASAEGFSPPDIKAFNALLPNGDVEEAIRLEFEAREEWALFHQ